MADENMESRCLRTRRTRLIAGKHLPQGVHVGHAHGVAFYLAVVTPGLTAGAWLTPAQALALSMGLGELARRRTIEGAGGVSAAAGVVADA